MGAVEHSGFSKAALAKTTFMTYYKFTPDQMQRVNELKHADSLSPVPFANVGVFIRSASMSNITLFHRRKGFRYYPAFGSPAYMSKSVREFIFGPDGVDIDIKNCMFAFYYQLGVRVEGSEEKAQQSYPTLTEYFMDRGAFRSSIAECLFEGRAHVDRTYACKRIIIAAVMGWKDYTRMMDAEGAARIKALSQEVVHIAVVAVQQYDLDWLVNSKKSEIKGIAAAAKKANKSLSSDGSILESLFPRGKGKYKSKALAKKIDKLATICEDDSILIEDAGASSNASMICALYQFAESSWWAMARKWLADFTEITDVIPIFDGAIISPPLDSRFNVRKKAYTEFMRKLPDRISQMVEYANLKSGWKFEVDITVGDLTDEKRLTIFQAPSYLLEDEWGRVRMAATHYIGAVDSLMRFNTGTGTYLVKPVTGYGDKVFELVYDSVGQAPLRAIVYVNSRLKKIVPGAFDSVSASRLDEWIQFKQTDRFPLIQLGGSVDKWTPDLDCFAIRDGRFVLDCEHRKLVFTHHAAAALGELPPCFQYFDIDFATYQERSALSFKEQAPNFFKILNYQMDEPNIEVFAIMFGRLLCKPHDKHLDQWGVVLAIIGTTQIGKSVVLRTLLECLVLSWITGQAISDKSSKNFMPITRESRVLVMDEAEKAREKIGDPTLKTIATNGPFDADVKHNPVGMHFPNGAFKHMALFGNAFYGNEDGKGSSSLKPDKALAERIVYMCWSKPVPDNQRDTGIFQRIKSSELVYIKTYCINAYLRVCKESKFWDKIATDELREERARAKEFGDPGQEILNGRSAKFRVQQDNNFFLEVQYWIDTVSIYTKAEKNDNRGDIDAMACVRGRDGFHIETNFKICSVCGSGRPSKRNPCQCAGGCPKVKTARIIRGLKLTSMNGDGVEQLMSRPYVDVGVSRAKKNAAAAADEEAKDDPGGGAFNEETAYTDLLAKLSELVPLDRVGDAIAAFSNTLNNRLIEEGDNYRP
jgi:hypothetical protein